MDAQTDHIAFCNYDGSGHHIVLVGNKIIQHPFSMSLFENYVYWCDWNKKHIMRADKLHGGNASVLHTDSRFQSMDLHIVHPLRQPPGSAVTIAVVIFIVVSILIVFLIIVITVRIIIVRH